MFDALRQLIRDTRTQKLRTTLTLFGIVWGTVAVSLLLAFGEGFQEQMAKASVGMGKGVVVGWAGLTAKPFQGLGEGRRIQLPRQDIELLRRKAWGLQYISGEFQDELKLQYGSKVLSVPVSGVEPEFAEMRNLIADQGGRFLNPLDVERKRRVAFLGNELAEQVFGERPAVGEIVLLQGNPFLVVGVMKKKIQNSNYGGPDQRRLWVPISTLEALRGHKWLDDFIFTAAEVSRTPAVRGDVQEILAERHRFDPLDEEALIVWDTTEGARFLHTFMVAFRLFLGILGSLTLVVGGIGVSNIMNVVVEERTREIGIKMALGARPRAILRQFLAETVLITVAGGAMGLGVAAAVCAAFPALGLTDYVGDPRISPGVAAATALLLGAIGLVSGWFPARAASRLDPVTAMKR
jgi:putative ABC transport system permease protein